MEKLSIGYGYVSKIGSPPHPLDYRGARGVRGKQRGTCIIQSGNERWARVNQAPYEEGATGVLLMKLKRKGKRLLAASNNEGLNGGLNWRLAVQMR